MNGRIYDPLLGRFLSADIVVQNPGSLQSYNRYSYVMNNPLTLTDPSGFMSEPYDPKKPEHPISTIADGAYRYDPLTGRTQKINLSAQDACDTAADKADKNYNRNCICADSAAPKSENDTTIDTEKPATDIASSSDSLWTTMQWSFSFNNPLNPATILNDVGWLFIDTTSVVSRK